MAHFSCIRARRIKTVQALRRYSEHGARRDRSARAGLREGVDPRVRAIGGVAGMAKPARIGTTAKGEPLPKAVDYVKAFKARKAATGARERKGSAVALSVLAIISPE